MQKGGRTAGRKAAISIHPHTHPPSPLFVHVVRLDIGEEGLDGGLRVAEQHVRVRLEEDRVVHAGVAGRQGALHHHHALRLPHLWG